jgi:Ni/Fe-hydrogenase subunit HybB-like protein
MRNPVLSIKIHPETVLKDMENAPVFYIWVSVLAALIGLGAYSLLMSFVYSLEIFEFSLTIPWGMMVSNYVFLVGSSTGVCFIATLGLVFGYKRYEILCRRGIFLAFILVVFGMSSIGLHLGHPERAPFYSFFTPNFRSAMYWMSILYPVYIGSLAVALWLLVRKELVEIAENAEGLKARTWRLLSLYGLKGHIQDRAPLEKVEKIVHRWIPLEKWGLSSGCADVEFRWARVFASLAVISGLVAYAVEGTLFAHTEARSFWYGALYPIDFFLGAGFCGFAWILTVEIMTARARGEEIPENLRSLCFVMAESLALLLSLGFLFVAYKMSHGLFEPTKSETIKLFLKGPFSPAFWVLEIAAGIVLPVIALLYGAMKKRLGFVLTGSIMVLIGYFTKRYDYVVAAQAYPVMKGEISSYAPAFMEVLLVVGILAGLALAYTLGDRFLPLKEKVGSNELPPSPGDGLPDAC